MDVLKQFARIGEALRWVEVHDSALFAKRLLEHRILRFDGVVRFPSATEWLKLSITNP